jgi:hypothetical protein
MEELSEVENVNVLKVDGVTRKARCESTDPFRESRRPILAPGCSSVCPLCVEYLDKKKCLLWLLKMVFGWERFHMNYKT